MTVRELKKILDDCNDDVQVVVNADCVYGIENVRLIKPHDEPEHPEVVEINLMCTSIGQRLKSLRSLNKQGEFAKFLEIPQPTLSAYERDKIKPTMDALINIADKCDVTLDWLCGRG